MQVYAQMRDWGDCIVDNVPTVKCAEVLFGNLLFMSSTLFLIVLFLMLVLGGYYYLTSFGSPEKVKKAQTTMRYAFLGGGLYLAGFVILRLIDVIFLGGHGALFRFEIPSP